VRGFAVKIDLPQKQLKIYFGLLISLVIPFTWTLRTVNTGMTSPDFTLNHSPNIVEDFAKFVIHWTQPETTSVALKQFRDVVDPQKSCLQQVIEAKTEITDFYGAGLINGSYQLTIQDLVSEPLASNLGIVLDQGKQNLLPGFWMSSAFIMKNGTIIQ
jgi:hypothetical protein